MPFTHLHASEICWLKTSVHKEWEGEKEERKQRIEKISHMR